MLVFESCGFGVLAILMLVTAVLVLVGLYTQLVWPLTNWDLTEVPWESFEPLAIGVLVLLFVGGSTIGFFMVTGAALPKKPGTPTSVPKAAPGSSRLGASASQRVVDFRADRWRQHELGEKAGQTLPRR